MKLTVLLHKFDGKIYEVNSFSTQNLRRTEREWITTRLTNTTKFKKLFIYLPKSTASLLFLVFVFVSVLGSSLIKGSPNTLVIVPSVACLSKSVCTIIVFKKTPSHCTKICNAQDSLPFFSGCVFNLKAL